MKNVFIAGGSPISTCPFPNTLSTVQTALKVVPEFGRGVKAANLLNCSLMLTPDVMEDVMIIACKDVVVLELEAASKFNR